MQNYGQSTGGYQRPGSTTGFPGPAVPPPYGAPQGYQTASPQSHSQWAPPAQNPAPMQQQWHQPQQYDPGTYGVMPGAYSQVQQAPPQTSTAYPPHQQDVPPPPPPKPTAFAPATQSNVQTWGQQTGYGIQQPQQSHQPLHQTTDYTAQEQQGGYTQQGAYQSTQQPYNNAPIPPPSQTPDGSYFPPSQTPQARGRPGSIYGADQAGSYSTPPSAVAQHPPSSILSPNEQQPAYIPPSLSGQGVQSYLPSNTNPMPGVYVPPPPNIPAWQQATHAPLQGEKKFKYTKPAPDPNSYAQAQGQYGSQPAQPFQQDGQHLSQYPSGAPPQQPNQYGQPVQNQYTQGQPQHQGQYGGATQPQYDQSTQQPQLSGQTVSPYHQPPNNQPSQSQPFPQQHNQWQSVTSPEQTFSQQPPSIQAPYNGQQQAWQLGPQLGSVSGQQHAEGIATPKPISAHTGTTPLGFVSETNPQSQPVSPIQTRYSTSFNAGHAGLGRAGSVSSIALGAIHAQRAEKTESPKPPPTQAPTLPPPRDDATKFSALGTGGPSDWEHFGGPEEVDDEELFGAKKDQKKDEPSQLGSVELPAHQVSPPQSHGEWPTPPVQSASTDLSNRDTYQPTPPPNFAGAPGHRPPSQPPQQSFVMGDVPPPQSLVMGDAAAAPHQQPQHQQGFVVDDAVVAPLRVSRPSSQRNTPTQQQAQHQPPPSASTSFVMNDDGWNQHTTAQPSNHPIAQSNDAHVAELKLKDDAFERLRTNAEKEKAELRAEVEQLKTVVETAKSHAEYERNVLIEQIESMKAIAEQTKLNTDALTKEKDSTIERLKEDAEGKEDTVREKDSEIGKLREMLKAKDDTIVKGHIFVDDLKKQLEAKDAEVSNLKQQLEVNQTTESEINDLRQQLEAEKNKKPPKSTPADLVSDIDPWYAGSLERYIAMLRSEALASAVEHKIKIFTEFLKAESAVRGLGYYNTPPVAPAAQQPHPQGDAQPATQEHNTSRTDKKKELDIQVPSAGAFYDDVQYSPGGRPIVQHKPTLKSEDFNHPQQTFSVSSQSTTVLTPTSSQDDGPSKTLGPVQSPPAEPQVLQQYKAYVPPGAPQGDPMQVVHRQSVSSGTPPVVSPSFSYMPQSKKDEVFFGVPSTSSPSRPATGGSATPDVPIPAPLFTPRPPALSNNQPALKSSENPVEKLNKLFLDAAKGPMRDNKGILNPHPQLVAIRKKLAEFSLDTSFLQNQTVAWEKTASHIRKKNDDARRKRQELSEERADMLFNDHEISYADIAVIEDEFKEKERELKTAEDRDEYNSYVETVFDKVYNELQQQIKGLMDVYMEAEALLPMAVSGLKGFVNGHVLTTKDCLELLRDIFMQIEQRQEKVVEAAAERDRRYKKTMIQPLYAAGQIAKMKNLEKHFADAERDAAQRARDEKSERVADFVRMAESTVIAAVGVEQQDIQEVIAAVRELPASPDGDLLTRAREAVLKLSDSSRELLHLLNTIEVDIGGLVLAAELEEVKAAKPSDSVQAAELAKKSDLLHRQITERTNRLTEELERKDAVLDQDRDEIEKLVKEKSIEAKEIDKHVSELSKEDETSARLQKALEDAKRRNGDL